MYELRLHKISKISSNDVTFWSKSLELSIFIMIKLFKIKILDSFSLIWCIQSQIWSIRTREISKNAMQKFCQNDCFLIILLHGRVTFWCKSLESAIFNDKTVKNQNP